MKKIRVADFIFKYLADQGTDTVFMVTGGGAMHLNDAIGKEKRITYICNHHEQASSIAAEGYSRVTGKLGVVNVTSGPGGTNSLTGVIGQWTDSVPTLFISGQVKFETTIASCPEISLRQLGDQEINIIDIVSPVVKYAKMVTNASDIKKELKRAIHHATSGRPGPVWLDIPLNIQGALIEEDLLEDIEFGEDGQVDSEEKINEVIGELKKSKRPVIIAGNGITISDGKTKFNDIVNKLGIPVVTTFNGYDLIESSSELFVGRIGTLGTRSGNFALQNADLVISIGSRNNIRQVSYNWNSFAREAKIISVDIDQEELKKKTLNIDIPIVMDANEFLGKLELCISNIDRIYYKEWLDWCVKRKKRYPAVIEEYNNVKNKIHPYPFIEIITSLIDSDTVTIAGNGTACVALFQAGVVKRNQRTFWNSGTASMGYGLPAAIGAATTGKKVVCITGEGSLQMNIQELQTIKHHDFDLKLIVLNNSGYSSIRQTQNNFFKDSPIGFDEQTGVSFPNMEKIANAYGIKFEKLENLDDSKIKLTEILTCKGPQIVEIMLTDDYIFSPKLSSQKKEDGTMISKPLEDMFPFLPRDEFLDNMIIEPMEE